MLSEFTGDVNAMAWLWKDHTAHAEAEEITAAATESRPNYLAKIGGRYSSEWFWAKILRCIRVAPKVADAAYTWVEIADWIPAVLAGVNDANKIHRGICAAGHKAFYSADGGGIPGKHFSPILIRSSLQWGARCPKNRTALPIRPANCRPSGRQNSDCPREFPSPSARLMRIWARSVRAFEMAFGQGDGHFDLRHHGQRS